GIEYLYERGIKPEEYIYNSISNLKNTKEIEYLQKYQIKSVVVLILGSNNMRSNQRYAYITENNQPGNDNIIDGLKKIGIEKIWIDGGVIDIESFLYILETQRIVSSSLKLPVGTAPTLFLFKYSSPRLNKRCESFASVSQAIKFKKIMKRDNIRLFDNF
ncbi:MAG: hypothetical protein ACTSQW_09075, partial [Promethearchaeota archaeon]